MYNLMFNSVIFSATKKNVGIKFFTTVVPFDRPIFHLASLRLYYVGHYF